MLVCIDIVSEDLFEPRPKVSVVCFFIGSIDSLCQSLQLVDRQFVSITLDLKRGMENLEKDSRSISDVKMMTDTRAVVLQQTGEKTYGYDGDKAIIYERFTLSKDNDKWLIEKCEKTCTFCDGTGRTRDYEYYFKKVYKNCDLCGGTGWRVAEAMEFN